MPTWVGAQIKGTNPLSLKYLNGGTQQNSITMSIKEPQLRKENEGLRMIVDDSSISFDSLPINSHSDRYLCEFTVLI